MHLFLTINCQRPHFLLLLRRANELLNGVHLPSSLTNLVLKLKHFLCLRRVLGNGRVAGPQRDSLLRLNNPDLLLQLGVAAVELETGSGRAERCWVGMGSIGGAGWFC